MLSWMETSPGSSTTYPVSPAYAQGRLKVGDGHSMYWEVRGNPGGKPAVVLHGGPGSGATASWCDVFGPAAYRVVLFDQRGCGRSTPNAAHTVDALKANTTQHLIADIEALRMHLEVDRWLVIGASWGSVLSLAYAQAHPGSVSNWFCFRWWAARTARSSGPHGVWAASFREEWRRFQAGVPETDREGDLSAAYYRLLLDPDPAVHDAAALHWCDLDDRQMRVPGEPPSWRNEDPAFRLCFARLVTHYWSHGHFLPERDLSTNAARLAGIRGILIRGALDLGVPGDLLWRLARDWPESQFVMIDDEGHRGGPATNAALVHATDTFAKR